MLEALKTSILEVAAVALRVRPLPAAVALQLVGAKFGATVPPVVKTKVFCRVFQQMVIVWVDLPVVAFAMGPWYFTEELVQR